MSLRYLCIGLASVLAAATVAVGQSVQSDSPGFTMRRDAKYGPDGHERDKLDLYLPNDANAPAQGRAARPLIVWVRGGAWLGGSKERPDAR